MSITAPTAALAAGFAPRATPASPATQPPPLAPETGARPAARPDRGGATAETTQTGLRIPPITEARQTDGPSAARDGGEGETEAALAREAAEREAEQRRLAQQALLSRIPVPPEDIPGLLTDPEGARTPPSEPPPAG